MAHEVTGTAEGARAPRMTPEERREMLIAGTLPLICQHGPRVTTRQIAEAAGVAEGTIFRAFSDKEALVRATVARAFDIAPVLAELAAVDMRLPLRVRLVTVTAILQRRLITVFNLMLAMSMHMPPEGLEQHRASGQTQNAAILAEVVRIFEPDRAAFRFPVPEVVRIMRLLTFAGSHPLISDNQLLTAEEIAEVVLHGTARPDHPTHDHERGQQRC